MEVVRTMPALLQGVVQRARAGRLRVEVTSADLEAVKDEIRRTSRRQDAIRIGAAILFGGLVWVGLAGGEGWPAWALSAFGVAWLVFAWRRQAP